MRTARGSSQRMATLTKVEKSARESCVEGEREGSEEKDDESVTKRGRQEIRIQAGERKARGNGTTC